MPINNITQTISTLPPAGRRGVDVQTQFVIKQEDFQDHLQGTTVTELNTFKDQLNSRIGEINSTATTMNGYASTASAGASTATTKAGEASISASDALSYKNQAETFKNNASASATKASQWADNNYNVEVETGKYSAKHWSTVAQNATANKVDKVASTDNAIVRFNGTTGDVQNSGVVIDDNDNVGIGTNSPANSKFNRTFTTQVTGTTSVATTTGDYSALSGSTVTAVESFGNRNDGNGSFGGRFGASYRRSDGVAISAGNTIGYYAFGGQWGTDVGYVPSKHLYTASICGVTEGVFTSSTAMATGISFRTGSTGESLGAVNTTYGTERMRIDASGNVLLTSATGGLGYGTGAGGTVTQLTSKSTAVTLNKPSGQIIMNNSALPAGSITGFTFYNSTLGLNDTLSLSIGGSNIYSYNIWQAPGVGGCALYLKNISGGSLSEALIINFTLIKGANS